MPAPLVHVLDKVCKYLTVPKPSKDCFALHLMLALQLTILFGRGCRCNSPLFGCSASGA